MQLKSVLVVFCALALALASAEEFRVFRAKRVVAVVPGYSLLCLTAGLCGNNYNNYRNFHPHNRYGPYYHNKFIPRHRNPHYPQHHGYVYGGHHH